jgi:ketosteroid isomerase-like protein
MEEARPMRNLVLLTVLAGASLACQNALSPQDGAALSEAAQRAHLDLREERAALAAAGNALSAAIQGQGVVAGLGGALAGNALFLVPGVPTAVGPAAITDLLSTSPLAPTALRWEVIAADVSNDATQGYTWGEGAFTTGAAAERPAFVLIYWRRGAGGEYEVAAMVVSAAGPAGDIPAGFGTPDTRHRRNFPNTEVPEQRADLLAVDAAFSAASVSEGSGPAFQRFAAPNAMAVGGGQFIFGPAALGEAFTAGPDDVISWTPRFADAAASGDLGFTVGDAVFALADAGTFYTKYLSVWQKQNTGDWKYVADFGNSRPAP